jgi:hypothetical protein
LVHLFRGAPPVRSWSRYKTTVEDWTLCGINRRVGRKGAVQALDCVEDASEASCPYCRDLMET